MKKIKTIFLRDKTNPRLVTPEPEPDCAWVFEGKGTATLKVDGSACLKHENIFYRRHALKADKAMPPGWLHWSFDHHQTSGHGWAPVTLSPADQYHWSAWLRHGGPAMADGTYEIIGPHFGKNPHHLVVDEFRRHGDVEIPLVPVEFVELSEWFASMPPIEGIVWHYGEEMAKVKRRDFGLPWPVKK